LVGGEEDWVGDFAGDPSLDVVDVGRGGDADGLAGLASPGVAYAAVLTSAAVGSSSWGFD